MPAVRPPHGATESADGDLDLWPYEYLPWYSRPYADLQYLVLFLRCALGHTDTGSYSYEAKQASLRPQAERLLLLSHTTGGRPALLAG